MFDNGENNLRVFFFVSTHLTCMIVAPLRYIYRCTLPAFSHGGRVHYLRSSCRRYATSHHIIVFCDPAPLHFSLVASLRDWGQSRPKEGAV